MLARTVDGQEAARRAPVEDEVAVREVVQQPRARPLRERDRLLEDALRRRHCRGVRRVVEIDRVRAFGSRRVPLRPARGVEREPSLARCRQRHRREVVRIARIRQQDRPAALDGDLCELDQRRLRARDDRDLARRIQLDAVDVAVPPGDRLLQLGQAAKRGISVDAGPRGGTLQRLDDVRRRPGLRVAAPEVDHVRARRGHTPQEPCEVLRRQPPQALRHVPHDAIVRIARRPARAYAQEDARVSCVRGSPGGSLPLLPVVRRARAPEARRVLPGSRRRARTRTPRLALLRGRAARAVQRLGRKRNGPRRGLD